MNSNQALYILRTAEGGTNPVFVKRVPLKPANAMAPLIVARRLVVRPTGKFPFFLSGSLGNGYPAVAAISEKGDVRVFQIGATQGHATAISPNCQYLGGSLSCPGGLGAVVWELDIPVDDTSPIWHVDGKSVPITFPQPNRSSSVNAITDKRLAVGIAASLPFSVNGESNGVFLARNGSAIVEEALDVSADGTFIVGVEGFDNGDPNDTAKAIAWRNGKPFKLELPQSGPSSAGCVSSDGSLIGGRCGDQPAYWSDTGACTIIQIADTTFGQPRTNGSVLVALNSGFIGGFVGRQAWVRYPNQEPSMLSAWLIQANGGNELPSPPTLLKSVVAAAQQGEYLALLVNEQ